VSAGELGLNPLGQQGSLQYSLVNGYYQAQDSTDAFNGDPSEADALILTGWVNKKFTLLVSFAGTDQASDVNDFVNFNDHYKKFAPLISAIKSYIDNNGVDQIFVSGHSLGAAMAQYFIEDAQFQNDPHFQARAWTIGSPGADNDSYPDARITNFVHPGDPIRWVPSITRSPLADKIAFIPALTGFLLAAGVGPLDAAELARKVVSWALPKFRQGDTTTIGSDVSDYNVSLAHKAEQYLQDVTALYGNPLKGLATVPTSFSELPNSTGSNASVGISGTVNLFDPDANDRPTARIDADHHTIRYQDANGTVYLPTSDQIGVLKNAFSITSAANSTNVGETDWNYKIPDNALDFLGFGETVTIGTPIGATPRARATRSPSAVGRVGHRGGPCSTLNSSA
jgi:Lipase (class 3)